MSNREERIADRHLDKITINYFDKLVQITCDEALKNYLEEPGNGAVELSAHILKEHKKRQKSELKISKDSLAISGIEFIRRFLMHVPPKRFVRIRHYGLLCSRSKSKKLTLCRNLLGCRKYISKLHDKGMPEILKHLYGINVCVCKICGGKLGKPQLRMPQRC